MTAEEIKSFLNQNEDLFDEFLQLDYDNVPELLRRLFVSQEYKKFIERENWKRARQAFGSLEQE